MAVHARTLFTHNAASRIVLINEPGGGGPAPRLFLGRTPQGNLWRFRADLPDRLITELEVLCLDEPVEQELQSKPLHLEAYVRLLETHAPVQRVWMGPAYRFAEDIEPSRQPLPITQANAEVLRGTLDDWIADMPDWQPCVAIIQEGRAVSICCSVRITPEAHEAGVETLPEFRGKGYAKDVVAGWARLVRSLGALPMYSTSRDNSASQTVARKLHMAQYGIDFHVT